MSKSGGGGGGGGGHRPPFSYTTVMKIELCKYSVL